MVGAQRHRAALGRRRIVTVPAVAALAGGLAVAATTSLGVGDGIPGFGVGERLVSSAAGPAEPALRPVPLIRVAIVVAAADDSFGRDLTDRLRASGFAVAGAAPGEDPGMLAATVAAIVGGATGTDITVVGHGPGATDALDLVDGGGSTADSADTVAIDRVLLVSPDCSGIGRPAGLAAVRVPVIVAETGTGTDLGVPGGGDGAALAARLPTLTEYLVFPDDGPEVVAALALLIDEAVSPTVD